MVKMFEIPLDNSLFVLKISLFLITTIVLSVIQCQSASLEGIENEKLGNFEEIALDSRLAETLTEEDDYLDEIINGPDPERKRRDPEKYHRQKGCLCLNRFLDPHCGSDLKTYDNGCYFMCAQERNPKLRLLSWSSCEVLNETRDKETNTNSS